jgi:ATP-dependent exoDNAse (exonuclease V) alpha subunit
MGYLVKDGFIDNYTTHKSLRTDSDWESIGQELKSLKKPLEVLLAYIDSGILRFELAYSMTTHKAQGSEFKTVYVNSYDMEKAVHRGGYKLYLKLFYTAMSRAKTSLKVIISPQPFKPSKSNGGTKVKNQQGADVSEQD